MDLNQSDEVYFIINTTVNVSLFSLIVLPTLILCLLCVLALLFAEDIDWQMRVPLINIFVAEICYWLAIALYLLGYPMRARGLGNEVISCRIVNGLLIIGGIQQLTAIALYAVTVYIFLKHGTQKLRWGNTGLFLVASWTATILLGLLPYIDAFGVSENNGFCETDPKAPLFGAYLGLIFMGAAILLAVMIMFGILTYRLVKRNSLQCSTDVKRAIAKYLVYLNIATILSLFSDILPYLLSFITAALSVEGLLQETIVGFVWVSIQLPLAITPVVAIVILKPIGQALKQIMKKSTPCRRMQVKAALDNPKQSTVSS
jgi:hypothetical protein